MAGDNATLKPKIHATYESAIDLWVAAMFLLTPLSAAAIGVYLFVRGRPGDALYLFVAGALASLITALFTCPCRYTIAADTLSVRCGVLFYRVPVAEIKDVQPSKSWANGPALSLKRVVVTTGKRKLILSPREREQFIKDLKTAIAGSQS